MNRDPFPVRRKTNLKPLFSIGKKSELSSSQKLPPPPVKISETDKTAGRQFKPKKISTFEKIGVLLSVRRIMSGRGTLKDSAKTSDMIQNILKQYIAPIVRHALTAAGGWLVSAGLPGLSEATVANITDIVVGIAVFGAGLGWSILEKRLRKNT